MVLSIAMRYSKEYVENEKLIYQRTDVLNLSFRHDIKGRIHLVKKEVQNYFYIL